MFFSLHGCNKLVRIPLLGDLHKLNNVCYSHESVRACLHILTPSPCPSLSPPKFSIALMVMGHLMGRMGSRPILPVRRPVTIGTIVQCVNRPLISNVKRKEKDEEKVLNSVSVQKLVVPDAI